MLRQKKYDPYTFIKNINDNTYGIDLPDNISIFKTLNVSDIFYFYDDQPLYLELEVDSRLSFLQVKGIEVGTYCKRVYEPNRQSQA